MLTSLIDRIISGSSTRGPPHAIFEEDNSIIYHPERYGNEMIFDVVRRKGSTGTINVTWIATSQSNAKIPFTVSPTSGELMFIEGQWNSSIHLKFGSMPSEMSEAVLNLKFLKMSGGAMLGNVTSLKVVFPAKVKKTEDSKVILKIIVPVCVAGVLVILGIIAACIFVRKRRR
jgi:hypothetical protein